MTLPGFPLQPHRKKLEPLIETEEARVEPATAEGNKELAEKHVAMGRMHQAITRYKKAARMDRIPSHRTDLGDAYALAELPIKALEQYKRAIKSNPNRPEGHFSLAEVLVRYGMWQAAAREYAAAAELCPENAYYRYKLANAHSQTGCRDDADLSDEGGRHAKPAGRILPLRTGFPLCGRAEGRRGGGGDGAGCGAVQRGRLLRRQAGNAIR